MYTIENNVIEVNGIKIYYKIFGDNNATKKLLLLHGWNIDGTSSWEPFIKKFQPQIDLKQIQIIAPDLPGMGTSEEPKTVWTAEDFAKQIHNFLCKVYTPTTLGKINLIGHSFGGAICTWLCSLYPQTYSSLVLVAPAIIRLPESKKQKIIGKITKLSKKIMDVSVFRGFTNFAKNIWYVLIDSKDYVKTKGIMKEIMSVVIRQDLQFLLEQIKIPTLILWGTKDTYTPFWQAKIIQKKIAISKLIVFENTNHGIHLHQKENLYTAVLKYLDLH